jgi:hypothetical protein
VLEGRPTSDAGVVPAAGVGARVLSLSLPPRSTLLLALLPLLLLLLLLLPLLLLLLPLLLPLPLPLLPRPGCCQTAAAALAAWE